MPRSSTTLRFMKPFKIHHVIRKKNKKKRWSSSSQNVAEWIYIISARLQWFTTPKSLLTELSIVKLSKQATEIAFAESLCITGEMPSFKMIHKPWTKSTQNCKMYLFPAGSSQNCSYIEGSCFILYQHIRDRSTSSKRVVITELTMDVSLWLLITTAILHSYCTTQCFSGIWPPKSRTQYWLLHFFSICILLRCIDFYLKNAENGGSTVTLSYF